MKDELRFLPIGVIVTAAILIAAGLAGAVIATPVLVLRGGATLSFLGIVLVKTDQLAPGVFVLLMKGVVGLLLSALGIGIVMLHEPSRRGAIAYLAFGGLLAPMVLSAQMERIDSVFIVLLRVVLFIGSAVVITYLTRPSTLDVFAAGGLLARRIYRYCPICGTRGIAEDGTAECSHCEGALLDRFETDDGLVFARPVPVDDEAA